jgi:uncharacterized protein YktA (UPF0223 family)
MYVLNNIARYSNMINHLELCEKINKSHINRSKLRGVYKNYVEYVYGSLKQKKLQVDI